ncbi:MAG: hypothetical protein DRO95_00590 [Candidatus Altiarchaeales archaeon]|nr:MAG: hypothetical protein DRO95_00590 [Candidatus Altiarchaeales archaeon]
MNSRFRNQKNHTLKKLRDAIDKSEVDSDILGLIQYINSLENFYTTSSCAGRISLIRDPGKKIENAWLGKWHSTVKFQDIARNLRNLPENELVWFKYEPAILHIVSRTLDGAEKIMKIARNSGFKRAGIHSLRDERYVIEICGTDRIDAPIADNGRILVDDDYLHYLVNLANKKYRKGRNTLKRLEENLRSNLS